jgi:hypothetical protein
MHKYKAFLIIKLSLVAILSLAIKDAYAEFYIVSPTFDYSQRVIYKNTVDYKCDHPVISRVDYVECTEGSRYSHGCDVYREENNDFDYDRRTADDVGADMDIDY